MTEAAPSLADRVDRTLLAACVHTAITRCMPGTKQGSRSAIWSKLTHGTRFDMAAAYCLDHQTCKQVRDQFAARLVDAKKKPLVTDRQVDRWLARIHDEFIAAVEAQINERRNDPRLLAADGQLDVLVPIFVGEMVRWLAPVFTATNAAEVDAKMMSAVLRLGELIVDAYKVSAKAEHDIALTERIRVDLKSRLTKMLAEKTREGGLDKSDLEERIFGIVDEAMLGKVAAR